MTETKTICGRCDHFFDPSDRRCHIPNPPDPRYSPTCPACTIQNYGGTEAWAVWNSCLGIWGDGVGWTRNDADKHLASDRYNGTESKVIPVRIYEELEGNVFMREWVEDRDRGPRPK